VTVGDVVAIIGPGAIGLAAVAIAREAGAALIVLVGTDGDDRRLEIGRRLGAEIATAADPVDVVAEVRQATSGRMADCIVDATGGVAAALDLAGALAAYGATVVTSGFAGASAPDLLRATTTRELSVRGARGHDGQAVAAALELLAAGRTGLAELAAEPVALEQAAETLEWFGSSAIDRPIHVSVVPQRSS
jgi:L-iditol 2-dehydrogenase